MAPLDLKDLALLMSVLMVFVGTMYGHRVGRDSAHEQTHIEADARLNASYQGVIDVLTGEIKRLNEKYDLEMTEKDREIEALHRQLAADRGHP